ncbi:MAG: hypothetical protein E7256_04340 [Lachnospiraceae bacterium]|nr:hypothetical protein [Lachnospiraceae bacterium]
MAWHLPASKAKGARRAGICFSMSVTSSDKYRKIRDYQTGNHSLLFVDFSVFVRLDAGHRKRYAGSLRALRFADWQMPGQKGLPFLSVGVTEYIKEYIKKCVKEC